MKEFNDFSGEKEIHPVKKHRNQSLSKTERLVILALAALAVCVLIVFCVVLILDRIEAAKPASENEDYVWVLPQKTRDKSNDGDTSSETGTGTLVLDGVMLSDNGGSVAVISENGMSHIIGIGEEINGWQLVYVDTASATLRSASSEMILTVKNDIEN